MIYCSISGIYSVIIRECGSLPRMENYTKKKIFDNNENSSNNPFIRWQLFGGRNGDGKVLSWNDKLQDDLGAGTYKLTIKTCTTNSQSNCTENPTPLTITITNPIYLTTNSSHSRVHSENRNEDWLRFYFCMYDMGGGGTQYTMYYTG